MSSDRLVDDFRDLPDGLLAGDPVEVFLSVVVTIAAMRGGRPSLTDGRVGSG